MRSDVAPFPITARAPRLEGLRVVVVGLGRSGLAAVRLAASKGARVIAADLRTEAELGVAAREARSVGAEVRGGGHPPALLDGVDLVVVSPGVRSDSPIVTEARLRQVPVWGEVELAWRFCRGRVLGITGSNGKSTVTSMAGAILRAAGIAGGTGGNLGTPLSELLAEDGPEAVHAVEISSFQLETIDSFHADGAVVVNLSPDHLDRYDSFDDYVDAKARLLEGQEPDGFAILNDDDPESARLMSAVRGELYRFSTRAVVERGGWIRDGVLTLTLGGRAEAIVDAAGLPVRGEHNHGNALAAALACRLLGAPVDAIAGGLRSYRALPHRLERVGVVGGVEFYDDSKATNLDAATRALRSFEPGTVHLILGGRDKGADWASLEPDVRRHARRVLLVGEAGETIRKALTGVVETESCGTVTAAVRVGFDGARPGDVVLLAPGCASFDQYRNFEERGDDFKAAVDGLTPTRGDHA
jgi:UDP-N-acetylmuramoylalanine--D-glutamate ligase